MGSQFLLPGVVGTRRARRPGSGISVLIILTLFLGGVWYVAKHYSETRLSSRAEDKANPDIVLLSDAELRLSNIQERLIEAEADLQKAMKLMERAGPYLRRVGMNNQSRWIESAHSDADAAKQQIEKALSEDESLLRLIRERRRR